MMADRTPTDPDCSLKVGGGRLGRGTSPPETGRACQTNEITALLTEMRAGLVQTQESLRRDAPAMEIVERLAELRDLGHRAGLLVLERHVRGCITHSGRHREQSDEELLADLQDAVERFVRSLH